MNKSDSIIKISSALLSAQKNIEGAVKGADNPYFKSKYANLNAVMEACKEHLNAVGISVLQPVSSDEHGDYVETVLLHESGEYVSSRMKLVLAKNDMQAYGSAVSYARRYGLQSMVFIGAEDDDGNASVGKTAAPQVSQQRQPDSLAAAQDKVVLDIKNNTNQTPAAPVRSSFKKSTVATPAAPKADLF